MAINVTVKVKGKYNLDKALSIFKKSVKDSNIIAEYNQKQEFIKPSARKRKKLTESKFKQKKLDNN